MMILLLLLLLLPINSTHLAGVSFSLLTLAYTDVCLQDVAKVLVKTLGNSPHWNVSLLKLLWDGVQPDCKTEKWSDVCVCVYYWMTMSHNWMT